MSFRPHQSEPGALVDPPRRLEDAIRPQGELLIARPPCEADALVDKPGPHAESTHARLDVQQPQCGHALGFLGAEHRSNDLAVPLRDPGAFSLWVQVEYELREYFSDESFEGLVPAVFLVVKHCLSMGHPANVAGLV